MTEPGAPTVYLHIGTPKSGTTYLQSRFAVNRRLAAEQGLLWPGPGWEVHVEAVRELWKLPDGVRPAPDGPWQRLVDEVLAWRGRSALISMEWLSEATPHQARVAVESLRPARVEVVCTARDLVRSFIAQGQEMAKNYRPWPWKRLVTSVLEERGGPAYQRFWNQQDLPRILGTWLEVVPADRVHLVTVPPRGADPSILWDRFCEVLGVDGAGFAPPERDNASLGVVSTVLMQRLNKVARAQGLSDPDYARAVRKTIAFDVLSPHRAAEGPITIGPDLERYLRERAEAHVKLVRELGVGLTGEWDDLLPGQAPRGRRPETVTEAELLELALEALVTLAVSSTHEIDQLRRAASGRGVVRRIGARARRQARSVLRRGRDAVRGRAGAGGPGAGGPGAGGPTH